VATKKIITRYNPAMCQVMIDMGMEGASQKMIWSALGISKSTAESWKKKYPDFAEALELSLVHAQAFWEREILANVNNKGFNSRIAEIALRGQFQQDYRETRDTKVDLKADVVIDFNGAVSDLIKQLKEAK
jgi:transposase